MNTLFENKLWHHPSLYVTDDQIAHLLGGTADSNQARIRRAIQQGNIVRLKRGLYYLKERLTLEHPHSFEVAQLIYGPSYISLESALSYHQLIPEAVRTITSVTTKRNKTFESPLGLFVYHKLPLNNFFIGVNYVQEGHHIFLLASPWKALLDYIFCYKKKWKGLDPIEHSLRIDLDDLPKVSRKELTQFENFYQRENINYFIKHLPMEYINEH